ncbi:hypothetical protein [Methylobacterium sp. CM6244]
MENWKDGVDPAVFRLNNGADDKVLMLEDISAMHPTGGRVLLEKGSQYRAGMRGGFLYCHLGGNKYNEAAILPTDLAKVQIARNPTVV